jgi:predicted phosphohydrolase
MNVGFDIISDLYLTGLDEFNWDSKPTSLFCLIPGNITSDLNILYKTLMHLRKLYQGVFFIDGSLENGDHNNSDIRVKEIARVCQNIPNVVYLHANVAIVDGVALIGINGWEESSTINTDVDIFHVKANRYDDIMYLENTIERLQLHVDIKKIIVLSNSIPTKELYFSEDGKNYNELFPANTLHNDSEGKIVKWVFGSSDKMVDTEINGVKFVNNTKHDKNPYYPKRIEVEV